MPLSLQTNARSTFTEYGSIYDQDFPEEDSDSESCGSSSSSLGRNSDSSEDSSDREDSGEVEVQSSFKSPLDTLHDLEQDLPVKKGISKFYIGKSRSFTSLADAEGVTCVQKIVKPEDPYAKKRQNLLARNILIGRSRSYADNVGGISYSKQTSNISRRTSCLNLSRTNNDSGTDQEEGKSSTSISPPCLLPPLHPRAVNRSSANASFPHPHVQNLPLRSYSWSDLQSIAEAHDVPGLVICSNGKKDSKVH